jgi:hypothetical protein
LGWFAVAALTMDRLANAGRADGARSPGGPVYNWRI